MLALNMQEDAPVSMMGSIWTTRVPFEIVSGIVRLGPVAP